MEASVSPLSVISLVVVGIGAVLLLPLLFLVFLLARRGLLVGSTWTTTNKTTENRWSRGTVNPLPLSRFEDINHVHMQRFSEKLYRLISHRSSVISH